MKKLNDVWASIGTEMGFYSKDNFQKVPPEPGVYAWFYPLRITTKDPKAFLKEISTVLNYDASVEGKPVKKKTIDFSWKSLNVEVELGVESRTIDSFFHIWEDAVADEKKFEHLRRVFIKASLYMPPLYVGKTVSLSRRCAEHRNGNDTTNKGCFSERYESYAQTHSLPARKVSDLYFTTISTSDSEGEIADLENLVEEFMKYLAKPPYSKR